MNGMSRIPRKILQAVGIIWTLLVHCNTSDTSVNITTLKGLSITDQEQWTPLVLSNSQETRMGHTSHLRNDQHSPDHKNVQLTLDSATNGPNVSFYGEKVSMIPYADNDTSFISQYTKCDHKKEAMLISICPDTAKETDKTMCQSDETLPTVDTIFPVTDSVSGYHFRNFYCWRCFNQSGEPLTWSGELAFTLDTIPDNYSSLASFLHFVDDNPAFATWKPPSQFSYPKCINVDLFNCTVCVPWKTNINGCSLVGRPHNRVPDIDTHNCYACASYQAKHSLNDTQLCENIHPEEVTYINNWLNFYSLTWNRSNLLMIERIPGKKFQDEAFTSQKCSVDSGICFATACIDGVLLLNGKCYRTARWFVSRLGLCQVQEGGGECLRQKPRDFLDKQFRDVGSKPINITALDIFHEERHITIGYQKEFCSYETDNDLELNYSESATLNDIITTPIRQLTLFHEQTDHFIYLRVNITEKNDFDSLDIEISGWLWFTRGYRPVILFESRLRSLLAEIMTTAGVEGNYFVCESFTSGTSAESPLNCKVWTFCPREIQKGFKKENKLLTSDVHKSTSPGIISGLGFVLILLMLHQTRWVCPS